MRKQAHYIEAAKRFLDVYDTYYSKYYNAPYGDKYRAAERAAKELSERSNGKISINFRHGMTRFVLIVNDFFVVKVDYRKWGTCGNCYSELRMFKQAEREGYGYAFCPVRRYCVNHHAYYIMPYCVTAEDEGGEPLAELDEEAYGYVYKCVDDLHDGNIGWWNGKPVLIDYAANHFSER